MKALITAGGRATRMRPITYTLNKHLIPLANRPMIFYAIEKIAEAGVREIAISVNPGETEIQKVCGDGSRWGVRLTYIEQQGGPLGIAHVVNNARDFLGDDDFIFYLGDNIILGSIVSFVEAFKTSGVNCLLALSKAKDLSRFGVPEMRDGRIIRVEEKPKEPKSEFAVTGIYIYDKHFFEAFKHISPSERGEYEISDIHTWLIENGFAVGYQEITGWWKDTGKPEDLLEGNALLLHERVATEESQVKIGEGTTLGADVVIRGPAVIGENVQLSRCVIGPAASIGDGVHIEGATIERSIVMDGSVIKTSAHIVDAIIGRGVTVAACDPNTPRGHRLIIGDNAIVEL